jgi:hypothetical protein
MSDSVATVIFAVGAQKIVNDYGAALESRKSSFADVSELPYLKSVIKAAILAALAITGDEKMRDVLKANFVSLADWQEGIGPGPHDLDVTQHPGETIQDQAKRISRAAPAYMELSKRVTTEMEGLLAELKSLAP